MCKYRQAVHPFWGSSHRLMFFTESFCGRRLLINTHIYHHFPPASVRLKYVSPLTPCWAPPSLFRTRQIHHQTLQSFLKQWVSNSSQTWTTTDLFLADDCVICSKCLHIGNLTRYSVLKTIVLPISSFIYDWLKPQVFNLCRPAGNQSSGSFLHRRSQQQLFDLLQIRIRMSLQQQWKQIYCFNINAVVFNWVSFKSKVDKQIFFSFFL